MKCATLFSFETTKPIYKSPSATADDDDDDNEHLATGNE